MVSETVYCYKCKLGRVLSGSHTYACPSCGETTYGLICGSLFTRKKTAHSRRRWFNNIALKYASFGDAYVLTDDFIKVVSVINKMELTPGKNISNYGYYLIRLASRRGIKLRVMPNDIRPSSKNKKIFDRRLFGTIYKKLGWDDLAVKSGCGYYLEHRLNSSYTMNEVFRLKEKSTKII